MRGHICRKLFPFELNNFNRNTEFLLFQHFSILYLLRVCIHDWQKRFYIRPNSCHSPIRYIFNLISKLARSQNTNLIVFYTLGFNNCYQNISVVLDINYVSISCYAIRVINVTLNLDIYFEKVPTTFRQLKGFIGLYPLTFTYFEL